MARTWRLIALVTAALVPTGAARAGWPSDPSLNLAVADGAGDQAQPKLSFAGESGVWVGWFDGLASGWDVRVQKLVNGDEILPHAGLLVADRGFSSTQDWGLDADRDGNALLAFRDDRPGTVQITAAKATESGTLPWGAGGVQVTATTDFVAAPKVAGTSDGGGVVAWTQGTSVKLQKLDEDGVPQWSPEVTLTPAAGSYSVSDLHDDGANVILSFVHQTGGFGSPRHLLAQKFDAAGAPLWGASPVAVLDAGSLQFGNFPYFRPDGAGGAVFSWYDVAGPALQCYAQHVLANGTEAYGHGGVAVSTNGTRVRVSPHADIDPGTSEVYVFWEEQNSLQSQSGVYGQKLDTSGNRQWGAEGVEVVPLSAADTPLVRTAAGVGFTFVFWSAIPSFGQDRLYGARLDGSGAVDIPAFDVASTPSAKSRLVVATSGPATGVPGPRALPPFSLLAWGDARDDGGDIYVQNVNADGSLGPLPTGAVAAAGSPATLLGRPAPNPSSSAVRFALGIPPGRTAVLRLVDASGRLVRRHTATGGATEWTWDGRDDLGRRAASGVYFLELRAEGRVETRRLVRVR